MEYFTHSLIDFALSWGTTLICFPLVVVVVPRIVWKTTQYCEIIDPEDNFMTIICVVATQSIGATSLAAVFMYYFKFGLLGSFAIIWCTFWSLATFLVRLNFNFLARGVGHTYVPIESAESFPSAIERSKDCCVCWTSEKSLLLHCGHTMCVDCCNQVKLKKCPMCDSNFQMKYAKRLKN